MPSFAISKFTVLLEPLWVSAESLLLSTGPLLYIIYFVASRLSHEQLAKMLVRGVGAQASRYICGLAAIHHLLLKTAGGFVSPSTNIGPRSRY